MEETIPISKFKATCLSLLEQVKKTGQPIIVTKKGEPIAQVISPPLPKKTASWLGAFKSTGKITGDIVSPVVEEQDWEVLKG
ncbi:MAG TPA: type II toxin-antitoxin system Phd/YefM family antitoxin [Thermodesulfobacteriota bacterium]|nr:type II toxin-antitoxin system Phd/YefM family antitoxin [Thermodesulfobacteriota bacterium]